MRLTTYQNEYLELVINGFLPEICDYQLAMCQINDTSSGDDCFEITIPMPYSKDSFLVTIGYEYFCKSEQWRDEEYGYDGHSYCEIKVTNVVVYNEDRDREETTRIDLSKLTKIMEE